MKAKFLQFIFGILILGLFFTNQVKAHVLETDGSIGIVMHADPEDDPIAKKKSTFYLDITDKDKKFQTKDCHCTVEILKSNEVIFSKLLQNENSNSVSFNFTLPEKGIYQLKIIGDPLEDNKFQKFVVTFDLRVEREGDVLASNSDLVNGLIHYWPVILIFVGFYIIAVYQRFIEKKTKNSKVDL